MYQGNFNVVCCYCGEMFAVAAGDDWPNDVFDESDNLERTCSGCGKKISIEVNAIWSYSPDKQSSDELNDVDED